MTIFISSKSIKVYFICVVLLPYVALFNAFFVVEFCSDNDADMRWK